ncbi:histidinol-phosphatase [Kiritimatiellaeota bacterium B1221]|nr:histidinol-phosphatase [Kiritimatiellaeota bacterium B1221]
MSDKKPLLYETHMHTPLCKHAQGMPDAYAAMAQKRGLKGMIVTCHCPLPDGMSSHVRMSPDEWDIYVKMVGDCREKWAGEVDVRLGIESDYLPGLEGWLEELHAREPLNYVLGSVHPQIEEYKALYFKGDWPAYHHQYFFSLVETAESGLFDCLSHPDLVKNYGSDEWDLHKNLDHIRKCLDRIAATGIAMEINTSGLLKTIPEMNPSPTILREMNLRGIPVVIGADAHRPERVAANYEDAMDHLEAAGYTHTRIFLDRKPIDIAIEDSKASLIRG